MSFNINKDNNNSSSMMSFKDYFITYNNLLSMQLSEGWGWFIDIESSQQCNFPVTNKYPRQIVKHVSIPPTINEIPSIRSFKSMRNLHEESMIFKMDENLENLEKFNIFKNVGYFTHSFCILGIIGIFYGCKFL
jgi:hypothetical protein